MNRARQTAVIVAAIGLALTAIVCGLFGYVAYNNLRLSREIQVRIGFERRLTAVIDELNHRVKNILAVIQSIVTRTLRHGSDIDVARELLIGRIHAMSNVVSLLSESQWQGVNLKGLFEARAIPQLPTGLPSVGLTSSSARARRSRCRCCSSNWRHIPTRAFRWSASIRTSSRIGKYPARNRTACFTSAGRNSTPARLRGVPTAISASSCSIAWRPRPSGGTSKRYFTDVSYVYELTAPMETVVDMSERDRTEQFSAPLKPVR